MNQIRLGLTGSIGMGKSTTAAMFRDAGVPVWDADVAVHMIYGPDGEGGSELQDIVPSAIRPDGSVDRAVLRQEIERAPDLLASIEARIHPLVAKDRSEFLETHSSSPLVVLDIPLLFETGADAWVDRILVVSTSPEEQRRRVLARPGMDDRTFERLLERQTPDREKRSRAHFVIETGELEATRAAVEDLVKRLQAEGEQDA